MELQSDPHMADPTGRLNGDDEEKASPPLYLSRTGLTLEVTEQGPSQPWTVTITNEGDLPVDLAADARLLSFNVRAPGKKTAVRCTLPDSGRPSKPDPHTATRIGPRESVTEDFDPRLYCFDAAGQKLLVPGALITPYFGWAPPKPRSHWYRGRRVADHVPETAPFVAELVEEPTEEGEASLGFVADKELRGQTFALRSEYADWSAARLVTTEERTEESPLDLRLVQGSDAEAERNATVELTIRNLAQEDVRLYFRRELVSFEVVGPEGRNTTCNPIPEARAPDRQAFMLLSHGERRSYVSRLTELCDHGTFATPGIYRVHARFLATQTGADQGLSAFTGTVVSREAAVVRIRTGETPLLAVRPMEHLPPVSETP